MSREAIFWCVSWEKHPLSKKLVSHLNWKTRHDLGIAVYFVGVHIKYKRSTKFNASTRRTYLNFPGRKVLRNGFWTNFYLNNSNYHSMRFLLPFNWPRVHHVTCKELPTNNGLLMRSTVLTCFAANNILLMRNWNHVFERKWQIASLSCQNWKWIWKHLGDRMIKQLLNSVITKYHDLSVSRRSIICLSLRLRQII